MWFEVQLSKLNPLPKLPDLTVLHRQWNDKNKLRTHEILPPFIEIGIFCVHWKLSLRCKIYYWSCMHEHFQVYCVAFNDTYKTEFYSVKGTEYTPLPATPDLHQKLLGREFAWFIRYTDVCMYSDHWSTSATYIERYKSGTWRNTSDICNRGSMQFFLLYWKEYFLYMWLNTSVGVLLVLYMGFFRPIRGINSGTCTRSHILGNSYGVLLVCQREKSGKWESITFGLLQSITGSFLLIYNKFCV